MDEFPESIARKLPRYPLVPATLVGRLAVSSSFRGQGLGKALLWDALRRCLMGSLQIASTAVIVDAKSSEAVTFYKKQGFVQFPSRPHRLFLPMTVIQALAR